LNGYISHEETLTGENLLSRGMTGNPVKNIQHLFGFELVANYDTLTHSYMETNRCAVLANVNQYSL
jgi:hypothetical protein